MSSFLASPVKMETKSIYPVENYGSAMAPFYSTLSIWVGGIVLVAMMKVTLSEERKKKTSSCKKIIRFILADICCFSLWGSFKAV